MYWFYENKFVRRVRTEESTEHFPIDSYICFINGQWAHKDPLRKGWYYCPDENVPPVLMNQARLLLAIGVPA